MATRSPRKMAVLKLLSLFSVIRGYNILVITLAQYLASIFILAPDYLTVKDVLLDPYLFMIVTASALAIAGGYIINNFYDAEKDIINKPLKSKIDRLVKQNTQLSVYFLFNFMSIFAASYVSFRSVVFFSLFIFWIWLYSHRLKKVIVVGNMISATLSIIPFFAVFVHYNHFDSAIFLHATFLFLLILLREFVKDLENLTGDLLNDYKTIPVKYGERTSKFIISITTILTLLPSTLLITFYNIGKMEYYFYFAMVMLILFMLYLWKAKDKRGYLLLHNILKFIIVSGVFSILLIDTSLVINRIF
ncbi:geranylgeranylglycerol-phosphate geranylgeranyltransferase [Neptunitalea lumnitzerae]|uniref:Ubiquinone biosynthesis protein UbiA n=1 Tax=Neptunitalea lumnitzerae TaxID=2965509 RepID=A0ABQ5MGE1_9FLAO|nr:geranylgeranylglycerol-phosphate geranylgeranyltransferase [Neptunitalea sp. Y10]GLB48460.1 ubiquinone biosynthesis protein UbiA [Neptunitalea sp. Y10]